MRIRPLSPTGDVFASQSSCHASCVTRLRGRIDFTTEGDAGATCGREDNTGSGVAAGKAVSWIPSLADEARDYIESVHAHSRQEFPSFHNFFLLPLTPPIGIGLTLQPAISLQRYCLLLNSSSSWRMRSKNMLSVLASARSSDYLHFGSKSCPVLSLWRATHCEMLLHIVVARLHLQDLARKQKPI